MMPPSLDIKTLRKMEISRQTSDELAAQALDMFEATRDFRFLNSALKIMTSEENRIRADRILAGASLP